MGTRQRVIPRTGAAAFVPVDRPRLRLTRYALSGLGQEDSSAWRGSERMLASGYRKDTR